MGLAGTRRKQKLSSDPNNTKWSRNLDTFGQKMLRAQGWQPGNVLGAKDAAHAPWHTEASAWGIHVVAKDDNLGIGARRHVGDECVGLDAFQHLLGRLNGKTEGVREDERKARDGLRLSLYLDKKVGSIRFVPGGWLEGDRMSKDGESKEVSKAQKAVKGTVEAPAVSEAVGNDKKSKKRKHEGEGEEDDTRDKKFKKRRREKHSNETEPAVEKSRKKKKSKGVEKGQNETEFVKKSKKRRKDTMSVRADKATEAEAGFDATSGCKLPVDDINEPKKSRKEKRRSKQTTEGLRDDEKVLEKKKKKNKRPREDDEDADGPNDETANAAIQTPTPTNTTTSSRAGSGCSTPNPVVSSRFLSRKRFIDQKRLALADPKALAQIFMIKS